MTKGDEIRYSFFLERLEICEKIKKAALDNGAEAIDEILGYAHNPEENNDTIEKRLDAALSEASIKEIHALYHKWCNSVS